MLHVTDQATWHIAGLVMGSIAVRGYAMASKHLGVTGSLVQCGREAAYSDSRIVMKWGEFPMFRRGSAAMLAPNIAAAQGRTSEMAQNDPDSRWMRSGAMALALSGVLFAGFPLVRPFFDDLHNDPAAAATTLTSSTWFMSHLMLIAGLLLLPIGLLAVVVASDSGQRRTPLVGALLTMIGTSLFLPVGGVEAFALPAMARLYMEGNTAALTAVDGAHRALQMTVFLPALVFMGLGGIFTAIGMMRSRTYSTWAGGALAVGLVSFMPLLPRGVRIVDGLLIGVGALWLARGVWQYASTAAPRLGGRVLSSVLGK